MHPDRAQLPSLVVPNVRRRLPGLPNKPPPPRYPHTFCETRQELAEGNPHTFGSYEGGVYFCDHVAKGYLSDGFSAHRDEFGDLVFVSHGGGRSQKAGSGSTSPTLMSSQKPTDRGISALMKSHSIGQEIYVIIGSKSEIFPYTMEPRFSIAGWFFVTHSWPEKDAPSSLIRYKFRFQEGAFKRGPASAGDEILYLRVMQDLVPMWNEVANEWTDATGMDLAMDRGFLQPIPLPDDLQT
ncbi:hypothetical protein BDK51DRAFT_31057, partial [Blyttiomyces helicus]